MRERIVFYQLAQKFVDQAENPSTTVRQVVYHSLALGHHMGILDCLSEVMEMPLDGYRAWISRLPQGSGRSKLEGVLRWGEIEITRNHANDLRKSLQAGLAEMNPEESKAADMLLARLQAMIEEPAYYLVVRKRAA